MTKEKNDVPFSHYLGLTFLLVAIVGFFLTALLLAEPSALWYILIPTIIISTIFFSIISILLAISIKNAKNINHLARTSLIASFIISMIPTLLVYQDPEYALLLFLGAFIGTLVVTFSIQWIVFNALKK